MARWYLWLRAHGHWAPKNWEERRKEAERRKAVLLESFYPEPKELGCTGTTLFNAGKRQLREALNALQLIWESQGRLKKTKNQYSLS